MQNGKIKVLVTDDSLVIRKFLVKMLSMDPDIEVIGTANNGAEAIEFIRKTKPDVITMDINMPIMDGFEATTNIMSEIPIPIVIVSSGYTISETAKKFRALEVGAVAILPLPYGPENPDYEITMKRFVSTVKLMSQVKLIKRWNRSPNTIQNKNQQESLLLIDEAQDAVSKVRILVIGASAGGPIALKEIMDNVPHSLPFPVIIVQHIDAEFTQDFADWLNLSSAIPIYIAEDGEILKPGKAYMAPGDHHIGVSAMDIAKVTKDVAESGLRPSVSFLFRAVRNIYRDKAIAVLLSGMGADGASELKLLKDAGSITIAQDVASSLIHGMPGEAIKLGGACHVLSPSQIVNFIQKCVLTLSKK
jgi:two-component system chemotaxis response regulator CheB